MIGKLRGRIEDVGEDWVILDVGGVGYEVSCSGKTLAWLQGQTGEVTLAIETHVREDAIRLFGFRTGEEREWFRLLQTVQGVGAKVALAVLGALAPPISPMPLRSRTRRPSARRMWARSSPNASSPS